MHPNQIYASKKQLQEHAAQAFDPTVGQDAEARTQREIDRLHAKIGEIENDFWSNGSDDERAEPQSEARPDHPHLSVRRQCAMLSIARSRVYRQPGPAHDNDLALMRRIDELFMRWPFFGSRRITASCGPREPRSTASPCSG